jgi:electron transport complex protein RnfG
LLAICFFATFSLAFTHNLTAPIIEAQKLSAIYEVDFEGMPDPLEFQEVHSDLFPDGIEEAFVTDDESYFVFKAVTRGFGGRVTFFVGMGAQGRFTGIKMGENSETPGFGNQVAAPAYLQNFVGLSDPHLVDAVTGVTTTSNALKAALDMCSQAFDIVKGGH